MAEAQFTRTRHAMPDIHAIADTTIEASIEGVVIRCGCADPMSHAVLQLPCPTPRAYAIGAGPDLALTNKRIVCGCGDKQSHDGGLCPHPRTRNHEYLAYWHRSSLRRLWWRIKTQRFVVAFRDGWREGMTQQ